MMQLRYLRYATLTLALSLCGLLAPFTSTFAAPATAKAAATTAQVAAPANEPAQSALMDLSDLNADSNAPRVEGNIAELQNLAQAGSLTELRATHNGSYGAKLFFLAQEMLEARPRISKVDFGVHDPNDCSVDRVSVHRDVRVKVFAVGVGAKVGTSDDEALVVEQLAG